MVEKFNVYKFSKKTHCLITRSLQLSIFTTWRFLTCMFCHFRPHQVGERFPHEGAQVPRAHFRLHHGLVPACGRKRRWSQWRTTSCPNTTSGVSEEVKRQVIQSMGIFHDGVSESCLEYFQRFVQKHFFQKGCSYDSFVIAIQYNFT